MKKILCFVVLSLILLSGCASTQDQELFALYENIRPKIVSFKEQVDKDEKSVDPELLALYREVEPYLPALDELGKSFGATSSVLDRAITVKDRIPPETRQALVKLALNFAAKSLSQGK